MCGWTQAESNIPSLVSCRLPILEISDFWLLQLLRSVNFLKEICQLTDTRKSSITNAWKRRIWFESTRRWLTIKYRGELWHVSAFPWASFFNKRLALATNIFLRLFSIFMCCIKIEGIERQRSSTVLRENVRYPWLSPKLVLKLIASKLYARIANSDFDLSFRRMAPCNYDTLNTFFSV